MLFKTYDGETYGIEEDCLIIGKEKIPLAEIEKIEEWAVWGSISIEVHTKNDSYTVWVWITDDNITEPTFNPDTMFNDIEKFKEVIKQKGIPYYEKP